MKFSDEEEILVGRTRSFAAPTTHAISAVLDDYAKWVDSEKVDSALTAEMLGHDAVRIDGIIPRDAGWILISVQAGKEGKPGCQIGWEAHLTRAAARAIKAEQLRHQLDTVIHGRLRRFIDTGNPDPS